MNRKIMMGLVLLAISITLALPAVGQTLQSIMVATLAEPNQKTTEVSTDEMRRILADGTATVFDARPHLEGPSATSQERSTSRRSRA